MPTELYAMNADERLLFLRLVERERKLNQSGLIIPEDIHTTPAPETLIIRTPASGIAPIDLNGYGTGTASGSSGADVLSSGMCKVCKPAFNQLTGRYEVVTVAGYEIDVLNVTPSYVFEGFGIASREKYGSWLLVSPWVTSWEAKTVTAIASKSSGLVNIWINDLVSSPLWQVTAWLKWMNGTSSIGANKEILIDWVQNNRNPDGTLGQWVIHERECP